MAKVKPKKKEEKPAGLPKFVPLKPDPEAYANFGKQPTQETDAQKKLRAEIIAKQKAAAAAAASGVAGINFFRFLVKLKYPIKAFKVQGLLILFKWSI